MVVVLSRLWLPLFSTEVSGSVLALGPHTLALPPAIPETQWLKSCSHSRDSTTTILLLKFWKKGCTMLGDKYFRMVYHDVFLAWYAQRGSRIVQPISPAVIFSNAVSKIKAQSSNVSFHGNVAKDMFELWALSFEGACENVTAGGIGCS